MVGWPNGPAQPFREMDQQLVADMVAEGVIDFLEVVEVDEQQAKRSPVALGANQLGCQRRLQPGAVRQPGQRIVAGLVLLF